MAAILAAEASSPYTGPVVWACLVVGVVFLGAGLYGAIQWDVPTARATAAAADAARAAADRVSAGAAAGKVDAQAQGALKDSVGAVADLAANLKDLIVATRLLVIGLALLLVAAVGAGFDALGDAAGDEPPATTTTLPA